jgi:hypothetical protein
VGLISPTLDDAPAVDDCRPIRGERHVLNLRLAQEIVGLELNALLGSGLRLIFWHD